MDNEPTVTESQSGLPLLLQFLIISSKELREHTHSTV